MDFGFGTFLILFFVFCGVCCGCIATLLYKFIGRVLSCLPNDSVHSNTVHTRQQDGHGYEWVGSANNLAGYQGNGLYVDPNTLPSDEVTLPVADAYFTSLAEVHTINAHRITGGDNCLGLQELHVETSGQKDRGFPGAWTILYAFFIAPVTYFVVQIITISFKALSSFLKAPNTANGNTQRDSEIDEMVIFFFLLLYFRECAIGTFLHLNPRSENLIEMILWGSIFIQGFCAVLFLILLQVDDAVIFAALTVESCGVLLLRNPPWTWGATPSAPPGYF